MRAKKAVDKSREFQKKADKSKEDFQNKQKQKAAESSRRQSKKTRRSPTQRKFSSNEDLMKNPMFGGAIIVIFLGWLLIVVGTK